MEAFVSVPVLDELFYRLLLARVKDADDYLAYVQALIIANPKVAGWKALREETQNLCAHEPFSAEKVLALVPS